MKKRAPKRTKTINYRREIWKVVFNNKEPLSKDEICSQVKGSRNTVFNDINALVADNILKFIGTKLRISSESDVVHRQDTLTNQLKFFKEVRKNTFNRIQKAIAESKSKSFFYRTHFTYAKPKPTSHPTRFDFGKKIEYETAEIWHINDEAKSWIFLIPHEIDKLIRSSFSLYTSQMLAPISSESYKEIFEHSIREVLNEIRITKKMLRDIVLESSNNKKGDRTYFEGWWWQLTVGLTLDDEPLVKDPDSEDVLQFSAGVVDAEATRKGMK